MTRVFTSLLIMLSGILYAQQSQHETIDQQISNGKLNEALVLVKQLEEGAEQYGYYGTIYRQKGQYDKALDYFSKELKAWETSTNHPAIAKSYSNIGVTEWALGNNAKSLEYHFRALGIRETLKQKADIAASYNDIGLVYSQTNPDEALEYYEKAMAIYKEIYDSTDEHIATAHVNIGISNKNIEFYGDAVLNLEQAAQIREANNGKSHASVAFVLSSLGNVYYAMDNMESAEQYQLQALEIYQKTYGDKHPEIANTYNFIGNVKAKSNDYEDAIEKYQNAIIANVADFNEQDIYKVPVLKNFYNADILLFSILQKAQALESNYFTKTLKYRDLNAAYNNILVCDSLIDNIRQHKTNEADKIALGLIATEVYEDGIRLSLSLSELNKNKQRFLDMAFYFAEKSKSAVLLDAIAETNAKSFANIPADMLDKEEAIKSEIAYYQQKLAEKPNESTEKEYRKQLFSLNGQYSKFTSDLETNYSAYFDLKFNSNIPSVTDLQSILDENSALISYFIAEKTGRLYAFVITNDKYKIHNVKIKNDINRYLSGYRNSIYFNVKSTYVTTAHQLFNTLIPKFLSKNITKLVIIPTGRLGTVPFEALLTKETAANTSYSSMPYLINKYAINIQYAATLFEQSVRKKENTTDENICLIAPVDFDAYGLPMLPGTATEVDAISSIFAQGNLTATTYLHDEANEGIVKHNNFTNSKYLHFATHGVVNEDKPELSQIYLSANNPSEDGNLYSGEIYNLTINADLVTLSACQTGLGKIYKGEGIIGLSRALVYSGANNLIVSLWSVADKSTSELMVDFYRSIVKENNDYSDALQYSKLQMISTKDYNAPFYWAPFILIGK